MIVLTAIGGIVGVLALLTIASIWKGYVLTVLWGWFVVPTFGLPALALAPAIGLAMVVSFLTYQHTASQEPDPDVSTRMAKAIAHTLVMPALVLGIGWVVARFV